MPEKCQFRAAQLSLAVVERVARALAANADLVDHCLDELFREALIGVESFTLFTVLRSTVFVWTSFASSTCPTKKSHFPRRMTIQCSLMKSFAP